MKLKRCSINTDDFSKKFISIEKSDTTAREIYIKMEQIEKKAEDPKANASNHCYIINFIVHVSSQFCQSTLHWCFILFSSVHSPSHSFHLPHSTSCSYLPLYSSILYGHSTILSVSLFNQSRLWKLMTYKCL